jgi:hypothetical protein
MATVMDTLLILVAASALLGVNLVEYAIVSRKLLVTNIKTTRTVWLFSSALVTLTPFFIPIRINTFEQMGSMRFGLPAYFVEQHFFAAGTDLVFPFYTTLVNGFGYSLRTGLSINLLSYAVDLFLCYVIGMFIFRTLRKIMPKTEAEAGQE